jgi:polysaccharide deacetylase family protein (PEP-CTERM system associated)
MPLNAVTIDLEDWYQGIEQPFDQWQRFEERIHVGTDRLLAILDRTGTKATFFVLGWLAEKHPDLIRRIGDLGHEIASHGYDHEKLYNTSPEALRQALSRAKKATEDALGKPIYGHRAPYFSLTQRSLWAVDILAKLGFTFDASVYPGANYRYGIPGSPDGLYLLGDTNIVEFPVSTFAFMGRKLGIGGAYFRILPLHFTHNAVREREARGKFTALYLHPWEFDPGHPLVRFRWRAMATHYFNLGMTAPRFERLLRAEPFSTMSAVIDAARQQGKLPRVRLQ